ncbi:hypothetical protein OE88DRAFT_837250 [Heliocybe sulcata]|uniref:Uncharacterized protein n=1 Tax=Heliocybe sulcata TaxID=5364 RepID=A0A5C3MN79_9AGAM|nr:hypothetical protein OE88DRAFT_837250 [Heliocybe sulcata]
MRDAMKNEKDKLFEEWTAEKQRFEEYISRLEGDKAALTSEREKREKNIALQLVDFSDHLATDCANLKEQRSKYKADLDESAKTVTRLREQMTEIGQNADRTTRERDQLRQQVIELEQLRTSLQELMEEHVKVAQERDEYQLKLAQSDDAAKLLQGGKDAAEQAAKHASEERDRALQHYRPI